MLIEVKRFEFGTNYTIGKLYIDGVYECYTLEDKVREVEGQPVSTWKIAGQTAIPKGTYYVIIDDSVRFGKPMPHITNVPGYDGVRIHSGNTDADTDGCILVGQTWAGGNFIGQSRVAFQEFMEHLWSATHSKDTITITVE